MNAYAQKEQKALSEKDKTGIPAQMKAKFERSSGFSFDDVRVHYNSEKPAQLHAHAYTQGSEVYVAPGQEKHLPHELGHVVQQKSNAVKPTGEIGGMPLNDDETMESGADKLAEEAENSEEAPLQAKAKDGGVVQREASSESKPATASPESMSAANWAAWGTAGANIGTAGANVGNMVYNFMGLYSNLKLKREEMKNNKEEKDLESIEQYVNLACEAYENAKNATDELGNMAGKTDEEKKAKKIEINKFVMMVKRYFEAALSKAKTIGLAKEDATVNAPKLDEADKKVKFILERAHSAYTDANPLKQQL